MVDRALIRTRLLRRLDRARKSRATWIFGPPGAGKTTLVASYLAARRLRALWYQLDEGDADVATFFHYLASAAPKRRDALPRFTPEFRGAPAAFARVFWRYLYQRLPAPFAVVFDNYQDVPAGSPLHAVLREAIAELPAHGRIMFLSRAEPPATFARSRVQQWIDVIEPADLLLTAVEGDQFVRRLAPRWVSAGERRALAAAAQGWAGGVVLLAEHLRGDKAAAASSLQRGEWRASPVVFDYFAAELFDRLPPETQEILLQTALLPDATPRVAQALTGRSSVGQVLDALYRHQYFTNKQAGAEPSYSYHPLFREFLIERGRAFYDDAGLAVVRRRAASLAEEEGRIDIAATLLRDAADDAALAALVCRQAPGLLAQGRVQPVEQWLQQLPPPAFAANPWLFYWRGMCRLSWQDAESQRDFQDAFEAFRDRADMPGTYVAWSTLIIAYLAAGNTRPMDRWVAELERLIGECRSFPSDEIEMRIAGSMLVAIYLRRPNHPEGEAWAERALALSRHHPDLIFRAIVALAWFLYYYARGEFTTAAAVADDMRALLAMRDVSPLVTINAATVLCLNDLVFAQGSYRRTVETVLELSRDSALPQARIVGLLFAGIQCALSQDDASSARAWLKIVDENEQAVHGYRSLYYNAVIRLALRDGDVNRAALHQPELMEWALEGGWYFDIASAHLVSAEVMRALGQYDRARQEVARALAIADQMRSSYVEFMARLCDASILFASGREAEGVTTLRQAMALGRAGSFVSSFLWHGPTMGELCARALDAGIEVEYVRSLVRRRQLKPLQPPMEVQEWPWPIKVFALGRFDVLVDDRPIAFSRKTQKKPLAMLKAMIAAGPRGIREKTVMDLLWPDSDGDAARFALTTAIHRLRRLLGSADAIVRRDGKVSVNPSIVWIDLFAVDRLVARARASLREAANGAVPHAALRLLERAADLYAGPVESDDGIAGAFVFPDRVGRDLAAELAAVARRFEQAGESHQAARWSEKTLR